MTACKVWIDIFLQSHVASHKPSQFFADGLSINCKCSHLGLFCSRLACYWCTSPPDGAIAKLFWYCCELDVSQIVPLGVFVRFAWTHRFAD